MQKCNVLQDGCEKIELMPWRYIMADYIENLTILHISDLHRAPDKRLNNMVLIDSLEREKEQYKKEGIPKPNLVVVSGDIVMGVKGNSEEDLIELEKQYDEAYEFMNDIANIFLDGNKSNVVIVPGNHDVSWFHSKTSMVKIDTSSYDMKKIIKNKFFDDDPYTRWCWNSFEFYDIKDRTKFNISEVKMSNIYFFRGKAATGKTTITNILSSKINVPILRKDDIKQLMN